MIKIVKEAITPLMVEIKELLEGEYFLMNNELFMKVSETSMNGAYSCICMTLNKKCSLPKELKVHQVEVQLLVTELED